MQDDFRRSLKKRSRSSRGLTAQTARTRRIAGARILEFPRSAATPPPVFDELAEPVVDRPRILEVPELVPPPPALGGILIEPAEEPAQERRPGFELPLQAAPMSRRLLAGAIDGLLVIAAFAVFAYIFFRVTAIVPPLQQAARHFSESDGCVLDRLSISSAGLHGNNSGTEAGASAIEPV